MLPYRWAPPTLAPLLLGVQPQSAAFKTQAKGHLLQKHIPDGSCLHVFLPLLKSFRMHYLYIMHLMYLTFEELIPASWKEDP